MPEEPNTPAAPTEDKPKEPQAPAAPEAGKAQPGAETPSLPEKFKGKTSEDIAKAYLELEKEHGKHSEEVKKSRDEIAQWQALGNVIRGNPELQKSIQAEIDKISGKAVETAKPGEPTKPVRDDTRIALEDQIINKFEEEHGLKGVASEKKKEMDTAIGRELAAMLDPTGTKRASEVLAGIPLDRLPMYLDKAYKLATADDEKERARNQAYLEARTNNMAAIGSISSSGVNASSVDLTPGEREAARRMNISEEDYKKSKLAILKGE